MRLHHARHSFAGYMSRGKALLGHIDTGIRVSATVWLTEEMHTIRKHAVAQRHRRHSGRWSSTAAERRKRRCPMELINVFRVTRQRPTTIFGWNIGRCR